MPGDPPMAGDDAGRAGVAPGWFIINIVPLNFGAAAFIANPHFVQVVAVSGFCIPQFGQNTRCLRFGNDARSIAFVAGDREDLPAPPILNILIDIAGRTAVACAR